MGQGGRQVMFSDGRKAGVCAGALSRRTVLFDQAERGQPPETLLGGTHLGPREADEEGLSSAMQTANQMNKGGNGKLVLI